MNTTHSLTKISEVKSSEFQKEMDKAKKIQSIPSDIFLDRVLEIKDRFRFFYMTEIEISKIRIEQKIVVREKDESLISRLKPQIESEGLIEPLTVLDLGHDDFLLLAGQHRYYVCKMLGITKVPAKIYLNLDLAEQLTLGYMSNEARKDPPAGHKYGALNEIFLESKRKIEKELKHVASESEIISQMYMTRDPKIAKIKIKEIILGMLTDQLINEPGGLIQKHQFISIRQVPKSKILNITKSYEKDKVNHFPLLTAKNAFYGLSHLVRTAAITPEEERDGMNFREHERQNVEMFFDLIITKYIRPWMESSPPEIDAAMNVCKRHVFETLCKLVANRLRDKGFDIQAKDGTKAPLHTSKKIPWTSIFDEISPFFNPAFLNHPNIEKERSLDMLWNRAEYYVLVKPGRMPYF